MDERFVKLAYEILSELFDSETTEARAARIQQWLVRNIYRKEIEEALQLHFIRILNDSCFGMPSIGSFEVERQRFNADVESVV